MSNLRLLLDALPPLPSNYRQLLTNNYLLAPPQPPMKSHQSSILPHIVACVLLAPLVAFPGVVPAHRDHLLSVFGFDPRPLAFLSLGFSIVFKLIGDAATSTATAADEKKRIWPLLSVFFLVASLAPWGTLILSGDTLRSTKRPLQSWTFPDESPQRGDKKGPPITQ